MNGLESWVTELIPHSFGHVLRSVSPARLQDCADVPVRNAHGAGCGLFVVWFSQTESLLGLRRQQRDRSNKMFWMCCIDLRVLNVVIRDVLITLRTWKVYPSSSWEPAEEFCVPNTTSALCHFPTITRFWDSYVCVLLQSTHRKKMNNVRQCVFHVFLDLFCPSVAKTIWQIAGRRCDTVYIVPPDLEPHPPRRNDATHLYIICNCIYIYNNTVELNTPWDWNRYLHSLLKSSKVER